MNRISDRALALALAVLPGTWLLCGCAHEHATEPAEAPAAAQTRPTVGVTRTTSHVVPASRAPEPGVNVSPEIAEACDIHFGDVEAAPKFDFDKSDLRADERALLDQVATCVTTGPLRGRSLALVGRADPRGDLEYNFALGESRGERGLLSEGARSRRAEDHRNFTRRARRDWNR